MPADDRRRRGSAADRRWWRRENWYRDVWLLAVTGLVVWSQLTARQEVAQRQDQVCTSFERTYAVEVDQLRGTYDYLAGLSTRELTQPLNAAVVRQTPALERRVRTEVPPRFCLADGVGLAGPPPTVPPRPPGLPLPPQP